MKRWYVVQVYTGFEDVVKVDLEKRIEEEGVQELIEEVLIPTGELVSFFQSVDSKKEKIFPGYLLVHMEMVPEAFRVITTTPRVSRFLGGKDPVAISEKEIERIFSQITGKITLGGDESPFSEGGEVHISSGPFTGFVGIVDRVDEDREKLVVMVSIFGRLTPVELGFDQVKK